MIENKELPGWAKKIENWSESFWGKSETLKGKKKTTGQAGFAATIIVNFLLLYIFNNLLNWKISWITHEFMLPLWIFNVSFAATIFFNLIFIIYSANWFRALSQLSINIISLAAVATLFEIFPFSLSSTHEHWAKIILIVALVGTLIAIFVEFVKLIVYIVKFIFIRRS